MKKIFRKEKWLKDMEEMRTREEDIKTSLDWVNICDGKEVIDRMCR